MVVRVILFLILVASTAQAQWKRDVNTPQGGWVDAPPAHNLAYFRLDPCSRPDEKSAVIQCDPHPSADEIGRRLETRTDLQVVGKVGAFTIYDLFYTADPGPNPFLKSVLVKTAPDHFHEIHVGGNRVLFPSEILRTGQQPIIKVKSEDGGNAHIVIEDYIVISKDGAALLDFAPVFEAVSKVVPGDLVTYQPTSEFDFKSLRFRIRTEKRNLNIGAKVGCCEGRVEVPFRIEHGRVVAGKAEYFPPGA